MLFWNKHFIDRIKQHQLLKDNAHKDVVSRNYKMQLAIPIDKFDINNIFFSEKKRNDDVVVADDLLLQFPGISRV